jgi:hypothetical protein
MRVVRVAIILISSFWVLAAYQNCGGATSEVVPITNPNSSSDQFLNKLLADSQTLITNQNCSPNFVSCSDLSDENVVSCLQQNASLFYEALACQGFVVEEKGNCFFAISKTNVQGLEPLHLEGTCFYDNQNPQKALHLDVCTVEYVGFDPSHPSTDTEISAWLNIGNQFPYSRFTKTLSYYPNQGSAEIRLASVNANGDIFTDACGKSRTIHWLDSIFNITVQ